MCSCAVIGAILIHAIPLIDFSTPDMKDDTLSRIADLKDRLQLVRSYL